jgi:hypothetical protein
MEQELSLDGAIVSASFDSSMDIGVVGSTAGTLWYISWTEGTSTRLVSGHRGKVRPWLQRRCQASEWDQPDSKPGTLPCLPSPLEHTSYSI